jgi:sugar lactone lactonase YvrE
MTQQIRDGGRVAEPAPGAGGYANGHTVDRQGRLISCEQGRRQVTRTEPDGSIAVLASHYDGKRLNTTGAR